MGRFSFEYMAENFKIGFTDDLGDAWWHSMGPLTALEGSTWSGPIPMSAVRQFFAWEPVKVAVMQEGEIGEAVPLKDYRGVGRIALIHSDTGALLGIHGESYSANGYTERLVEGLEAILDDTLEAKVGSMGILDGGQQAWIQIRSPKVIEHHTGEKFYPWVSAYSSLDGSLANTFKEGTTRIECDNTFQMFQSEAGKVYKYRNTSNATLDVLTARSILDLLEVTAQRYTDTVDTLVDQPLRPEGWDKLLDIIIPLTTEKGVQKAGKSLTMAENKRNAISEIYYHDNRVGPFVGTHWGALQAFSTFDQHGAVDNDKHPEEFAIRNAKRLLAGRQADHDSQVLAALAAL